jgi:hypothetical protein
MGIIGALGCAFDVLLAVCLFWQIVAALIRPPKKRGPERDEPVIRRLQGPDRKD